VPHAGTGCDNKTVNLHLVAEGYRLLATLQHSRVVRSVQWSPDSKFLATGAKEESIHIWKRGAENMYTLERTIDASSSSLWSISWSPSGREVASGSWHADAVRIWNTRSGKRSTELRGHTSFVCSVAWAPNGRLIASGSCDDIRLWGGRCAGKEEEEEGEGCSALSSEMACKKGTGVVWSLDWADDGATLACGSSNQTVQLLDAAAGDKARGGGQQQQPLDVIKELCGHRGVVRSVAWTRRECTTRRRLASAGDDSLVIVWQ